MCTNLRSRQNGVRSLPRHLRHISKMKLVIRKLFFVQNEESTFYTKNISLQKRINQAFNYFVIKQQRNKCNIFCSEGARRKLSTMRPSWLTSRMSANFLRIGIILMYVHMYRYIPTFMWRRWYILCYFCVLLWMISIHVCDAPSIPFFLLFRVIDFAFCLLLCEIAFWCCKIIRLCLWGWL